MEKKWIYKKSETVDPQVVELAGDSFLAQLLAARGINTYQSAYEFFNPEKTKLIDPYAFSGMKDAVDRIEDAIVRGEHIVIYGDFDADGVTSTAVLIKTFEKIGANFSYYIPDRAEESHGMNTGALVSLVSKRKAKLVITVDCGVSNVEEAAFLKSFKVDTIITDHHEAPDNLPEVLAIINPRAMNALDEKLSSHEIQKLCQLSGVGIAFKLASALLERFKQTDYTQNLIPLVALGAVADVVPILGENRYFVAKGIKLIEQGVNKGIKALLASCSNNPKVTSETIAFMIAPRINASGRLATVDSALQLLTSEDDEQIKKAVDDLNSLNSKRQDLCDKIFNEALMLVNPEDDAIVLMKDDWHVGVIGIVASKLTERFNKPVFLMCKDEQRNLAKCSCRSIEQINIYDIISVNSDFFEVFGGHAMAGGFLFDLEKYSFEQVKDALISCVKEASEGLDLTKGVLVDAELSPADINIKLVETLEKLDPFGEGNPPPLFCARGLNLKQYKTMGQNGAHLKFFAQKNNLEFECIMWNASELPFVLGSEIDIVFAPRINNFNGKTSLQLEVCDIKGKTTPCGQSVKIYDHRKRDNVFGNLSDYLLKTDATAVIYAQNRDAVDILSRYEILKNKIVNQASLKPADILIMFDYPSDAETLRAVISKVKPKNIHLMKDLSKKHDFSKLMANLAGMLKFVHNKNSGKLEKDRICAALGIDCKFFEEALKILSEVGSIQILDNDKISFVKGFNMDNLKACPHFNDFFELKNKTDKFKDEILGLDAQSFLKTYGV